MRIGQHSAKVIFFASADAWIQAKPLIKLMELKTSAQHSDERSPKINQSSATSYMQQAPCSAKDLFLRVVPKSSHPRKRSQRLVSPTWAE